MKRNRCAAGLVCVICSFLCAAAPPPRPTTQHVPREQWSGVIVNVKQEGDRWRIDGLNRYVTFLGADFSVMVQAGATAWTMPPPAGSDLSVKVQGERRDLRLLDARHREIEKYDTGFSTGIKITLWDWERAPGLKIFLTLALEGMHEELSFTVAAVENGARIQQLDWPPPLDPALLDCTYLPNHRGVMLPRNWPKPYFPIRSTDMGGNPKVTDTSEIQ